MSQESPTTKIVYVPWIIEQLTVNQVFAEVAQEAEVDPAAPPPFVETEIIPDPLVGRSIPQDHIFSLQDIETDSLGPIQFPTERPFSRVIMNALQFATSILNSAH